MDLYRGDEIDAIPQAQGAISLVGSTACADALWKAGKPATTWGFSWRENWTFHLVGRHVVLMPERNDVAWSIARHTCKCLYGWVASMRWIVLPVDGSGGVLAWFERGGDVQKLSRLVKATPVLCNGQAWNEQEFDRVWAANEKRRAGYQ